MLSTLHELSSKVEKHRSNERESRFEEVLEWQIGRLAVYGLDLQINGQRFALADDGWSLRGFVGSDKELQRRLFGWTPQKLSLAGKLLKDSSEQALKIGVSGYTGKEDYQFGDLTKATIDKMGASVSKVGVKVGESLAAGVSEYTGKEAYQFGDLAKATMDKVGAGVGINVAAGVSSFTGKEEYRFGDLAKAAISKVGEAAKVASVSVSKGVAEGVSDYTGKEEYQVGDVIKATVSKMSDAAKTLASKLKRHEDTHDATEL